MSRNKAYARDLLPILRRLDIDAVDALARKWKLPMPAHWQPHAKLAMLHKARVHAKGMTDYERDVSRAWLAANGFTDRISESPFCPECGQLPSYETSCAVCKLQALH